MGTLKPFMNKGAIEAGCDEAGRGCLAGPVFAAAVILPPDYDHPFLDDSKKLSPAKRYDLRDEIIENAKAWAVAMVLPAEIDEMNILNASILAMHRAVEKLNPQPEHLIIDGNRFTSFRDIPFHCIVKGDQKYLSIAAASILAKTFRDDYMACLDEQLPEYGWKSNKGYPTQRHQQALEKFGVTVHHRKSFRLRRQLKMPFGNI
ncbi:MAG: ribonuclease HII [Bacteroidales bacterium]|nr:ribonuclease HII [Bacteroidales bacterium]